MVYLFVCWGSYVYKLVCLLVGGCYVCKLVCQSNSFLLGLSVCWLVAMDLKLQMGRLLAIFGVHLSNFFLCGLLLLCVLPWVICFMFGVLWVLGFL